MNTVWENLSARIFEWFALPLMIAGFVIMTMLWFLEGVSNNALVGCGVGALMLLVLVLIGHRNYYKKGRRFYFYAIFAAPSLFGIGSAIVGLLRAFI